MQQCNAMQRNTTQHNTVQCSTTTLHSAIQCNATQCNTAQHSAMQCNTVQCSTTTQQSATQCKIPGIWTDPQAGDVGSSCISIHPSPSYLKPDLTLLGRTLTFLTVGGKGVAQDVDESSSFHILAVHASPPPRFPLLTPTVRRAFCASPRWVGSEIALPALGTWTCSSNGFSRRHESQSLPTFPVASVSSSS